MIIIGYVFALVVGISLGLIGGGGSILAVPILKYIMGVGEGKEIAMSLGIVGFVSMVGVIPHWFQGNVNLKTSAIFIPPAMIGAYLGAKLAGFPFVKENNLQIICFGIVMILASYFMIRPQTKPQENPEQKREIEDDNFEDLPRENQLKGQKDSHLLPPYLLILIEGLFVGILTGFVGVGGGFLIIPALVLLGGIPMKEAVGTSLLIITFKSASGFFEYAHQLNFLKADWLLMGYFTLSATIGIIFGAYLTRFVDGKHLEKAFGYFVLAIAAYILIRR